MIYIFFNKIWNKYFNILNLLWKKARAFSENGGNVANNAIDSDVNTRWESQHGKGEPEWIQIDLEDIYIANEFKIIWETASAKEYQIQVSNDGIEWKLVYEITNGKEGETKIGNFDSVSTKYVRFMLHLKIKSNKVWYQKIWIITKNVFGLFPI